MVEVLNQIEDLAGMELRIISSTTMDATPMLRKSTALILGANSTAAPQITLVTIPNQLDSNGVFHIAHTENKTHILNVSAIDADGDDLNYSIYGWQDLQHFEINATSGDLSFKNSPDYESPNDHDKDGVYGIVLRVSDNKVHHDQPVYIWVVNENEAPSDLNLTASGTLSVAENQPSGTIVGQLTGSDQTRTARLIIPACSDREISIIPICNRSESDLMNQRSFDYESDDHNLRYGYG